MDRYLLYLFIFGVSLVSSAYFFVQADANREMSIPPTNAFSKIIIGNNTITANDWGSTANLTGKTNGYTVSGSGSLTCSLSGTTITCKLKTISCPVLQGLKGVDSSGNLFCSTL